MAITVTTVPNWTPGGSLHKVGFIGSKMIAVDLLQSASTYRFVVWDLDTDVRNAYGLSFDAGYAPFNSGYAAQHSQAVDTEGLWVPHYGSSGWCMTRCNLDGSFDQWTSTITSTLLSPDASIGVVSEGVMVYVIWRSGSATTRVLPFNTSTETWGTETAGAGNVTPATKMVKRGGYFWGLMGNSVIRFDPATQVLSTPSTWAGPVNAATPASHPVDYDGYLWWAVNTGMLRVDTTTGANTFFPIDVPWGPRVAVRSGVFYRINPGDIAGWNPVTNERWVDSYTPSVPNTSMVFMRGGEMIGTY